MHLDGVRSAPLARFSFGFLALPFGAVGKEGVVEDQRPLGVEARHLAAGSKTRVDGHDAFRAERRGQQELPQVPREHTDRLGVGALLDGHPQLGFHRPAEQAAVAVVDGRPHLFGVGAGAGDEKGFQLGQCVLFGRRQGQVQDVLGLPAAHGEHPMGGGGGRRFRPLEIVLELGAGFLPAGGHAADDQRPGGEQFPQAPAGRLVLVDDLGDDVARAGQRLLGVGHTHVRVHINRCRRGRVGAGLLEQGAGQGLEPLLPGRHGPGASFGAIGKVDILQGRERVGRHHGLAQLLGQVPVLFKGLEDRGAALVELPELLDAVADIGDGDLVQASGDLLAVARDERDRGAVRQQGRHGAHTRFVQIELAGDAAKIGPFPWSSDADPIRVHS